MSVSNSDNILSPLAPEPVGAYPHARRVGKLLFLSGVGPRERGKQDIPGVKSTSKGSDGSVATYDFEAQCHSVFRNVKIILEEAGATWESLVDVTVYLTDLKRDFAAYNRIYSEYFQKNRPCRTTVGITSLPTPIAIELKCIAIIE